MVQLYANVPAVGNVRDTEPVPVSGMFVGEFAVVNVTLCRIANDHDTDPLRAITTFDGVNWLPAVAATDAVVGAPPTVAVTVCVFVTEPIVPVAVICDVPAATPVTTPAFVTVAFDWSLDV